MLIFVKIGYSKLHCRRASAFWLPQCWWTRSFGAACFGPRVRCYGTTPYSIRAPTGVPRLFYGTFTPPCHVPWVHRWCSCPSASHWSHVFGHWSCRLSSLSFCTPFCRTRSCASSSTCFQFSTLLRLAHANECKRRIISLVKCISIICFLV